MQTVYKVNITLKAAGLERVTEAVVDFDAGVNPQDEKCRVIKFDSLDDLLRDKASCSACSRVRTRRSICGSSAVSCLWRPD